MTHVMPPIRRLSRPRRGLVVAALAACSQPAPVRTTPPMASSSSSGGSSGSTATPAAVPNTQPDSAGWVALFDGTPASLAAHWRGYRQAAVPAGWRVEDGALALVPGAPDTHGDLATRDQYGDFELEYQWRVPPGANSGVMWRVSEDQPFPWQTGPEQQVLDDARHPDGRIPSHRAGALYDLVVPPAGITRPVGEFNQARVVAQGSRVQLVLNGRPTATVDFASDSGRRLVAASKFRAMPGFARNARGHIVLQDHGDRVWFRDVRVRRLDTPAGRSPAAP